MTLFYLGSNQDGRLESQNVDSNGMYAGHLQYHHQIPAEFNNISSDNMMYSNPSTTAGGHHSLHQLQ